MPTESMHPSNITPFHYCDTTVESAGWQLLRLFRLHILQIIAQWMTDRPHEPEMGLETLFSKFLVNNTLIPNNFFSYKIDIHDFTVSSNDGVCVFSDVRIT